MKKQLLYFIICVFIIKFVSAVPPVQTTVINSNGLYIQYPQFEVYEKESDISFDFHVYNLSNGLPISDNLTVYCNFHIYNISGSHVYSSNSNTFTDNFDYEFLIDKNNFTIGDYSGIIQCNDTENGGYASFGFEVTPYGRLFLLINTILPITLLIISIILLFIGNSFKEEKILIKSSIYLASLLLCLLALNSSRIIASESSRLFTMSTAGLILLISIILVYFLYVFVNYLVSTFKQLKDKKAIRWQY